MTLTANTSLRESLELFKSELIQEKRGDKFIRVLKQGTSNHSKFQELVRSLHMDEFPNDWRYETIYDLTCAFLEYFGDDEDLDYDNCSEALNEISENLADYSTSGLFQWLAENPSRASFDDDYEIISSIDESVDLAYLARSRQIEEITIMGSNLIYHFTQEY